MDLFELIAVATSSLTSAAAALAAVALTNQRADRSERRQLSSDRVRMNRDDAKAAYLDFLDAWEWRYGLVWKRVNRLSPPEDASSEDDFFEGLWTAKERARLLGSEPAGSLAEEAYALLVQYMFHNETEDGREAAASARNAFREQARRELRDE